MLKSYNKLGKLHFQRCKTDMFRIGRAHLAFKPSHTLTESMERRMERKPIRPPPPKGKVYDNDNKCLIHMCLHNVMYL